MMLNWIRYDSGSWCEFLTVDLSDSHFNRREGVYVIWHEGVHEPETVYVGQGYIRDCIQRHRNESNILRYRDLGLKVTWADVIANQRDGVERYLANTLRPLEGDNHPDANPMPVNIPWRQG